jgi:hypothetical protein
MENARRRGLLGHVRRTDSIGVINDGKAWLLLRGYSFPFVKSIITGARDFAYRRRDLTGFKQDLAGRANTERLARWKTESRDKGRAGWTRERG